MKDNDMEDEKDDKVMWRARGQVLGIRKRIEPMAMTLD